MIAWTWDGWGATCSGAGVADDEDSARRSAAAWMQASGADHARVEKVQASTDISTLMNGYARTGYGWDAERRPDGRIRWRRFRSRQAVPAVPCSPPVASLRPSSRWPA